MFASIASWQSGELTQKQWCYQQTEVKKRPETFVTEEQVKVIQAKDWLTLKEVALLLNVSPLTLRRWTLSGKIASRKIGRKHLYDRSQLLETGLSL